MLEQQKILIVDDNDNNRKLLRVILEKSGYEVHETLYGEEGIRLAKELIPDLILMDVQLPTMSGLQATAAIKSDDTTSEIPVIAVTSYAMIGDREIFLSQGFDEYIPKPVNINELIETVKKYIGNVKQTL
jgi:CheY-like chemotaxis protein